MDGYPAHLSPIISGSDDKAAFDVWWPRVRDEFPGVPDVVAKDWLYRHWGNSPYRWIVPRAYDFTLEEYASDSLGDVLSRVFAFEAGGARARDTGQYLCGDSPLENGVAPPPARPWRYDPVWLVDYMRTHGTFPAAVVVVDNRDGHLKTAKDIPEPARQIPQGLILAEGHARHAIGLHLRAIGALGDSVPICRLTAKRG